MWRLYEIRQPPTCLCTTSNFLTNAIVLLVEMVIMVRMVRMVEREIMVLMVIMVELVIMVETGPCGSGSGKSEK